MGWVAIYNFESVDLTLKHPSDRVQREMRDIGLDRSRVLLRFHSAELNRHFFYNWETVQLVLAIVLAIALLFATNGSRFALSVSLSMLAIVLIQHFTMTPQMLELGRGLDFAAPDELLDERRSFSTFHSYYSIAEILKGLLGAVLGARMLLSSGSGGRRRRPRNKVDVVDHADHRHVDR